MYPYSIHTKIMDFYLNIHNVSIKYPYIDFSRPSVCALTAGGVASVGERATFSSPDENARAGETVPMFQFQPTLATPLVGQRIFLKV